MLYTKIAFRYEVIKRPETTVKSSGVKRKPLTSPM